MVKNIDLFFNKFLKIIFHSFAIKNKNAHSYIIKNIISQRKLLVIHIISGVGAAFFEGISLALLYLVIKLLSSGSALSIEFSSYKFLNDDLVNFLSKSSFENLFLFFLISAVLFQLLQSSFLFINKLSSRYIEARCLSEVTNLIHSKILSLQFPFVSKFKVGDLSNYVNQCPLTIRMQIDNLTTIFISSLISVTYLFLLINISFKLLSLVFFVIFLVRLITKKLYPAIRKFSNEATSSEVLINEKVVENFQGIRLIHVSGMQNKINNEIKSKAIKHEKILRRKSRKLELLQPIVSFIPVLVLVSISLYFNIDNLKTSNYLPILGTFFVTLQRLNTRVSIILTSFGNLQDNSSRIKRLDKILSIRNDQTIRQGGLKLNSKIKSVCFQNVVFSYNKNKLVLKKINFQINKGEVIALVGVSGSGKSSLVDLLGGLFKTNAGEILINGTSINYIDLDDWRKRISIVNQDNFLFNKSIISNLSFGNTKLTIAEIKKACKAAQAHDFIESLPDSYNTVIGERGFKLSGGQRQRIAIARAIARNSEFLILDEATSALDSKNESLIYHEINKTKLNRLTLIISHRLSTIKNADKIIVLDKGRMIEFGNHNELLKNKSFYYDIWEAQK